MTYPQLIGRIQGTFYPPPFYAVILSNIGSWLMWGAIAFQFAGDSILGMLGVSSPPWLTNLRANPMRTFVVLFILNTLAGSMTKTGAFEVYVNGATVFSRLETGRFPSVQDIHDGFSKIPGMDPPRRF